MPIKFAKPLVFGVVVASSLIVVGAVRLTAPKGDTAAADPNALLPQVGQVVQGAFGAGKDEGIRETVAPPTLPAALAARGAVLDTAVELAQADVETLLCARAAQYLSAAQTRQHSESVDVERWLLDQLSKENAEVKRLMATNGSMDGSAGAAAALDSPLRNRAAILQALNALYVGENKSCRVAAFDSATQIDSFSFEAMRIKENQQQSVAPAVEVPTDG
jgi:hypothetical protein